MTVAFCYLDGKEQIAALTTVIRASQGWLTDRAVVDESLYALVESTEAVDLCWLTDVEAIAAWPAGRIFGPQGELRWQREDGITHVVLVSERGAPPLPFTGAMATTEVETAATVVYLWGNGIGNGVWQEQRLPDPLRYPVRGEGAGRRVLLQMRRYRETARMDDGTIDFVRYVGLELA